LENNQIKWRKRGRLYKKNSAKSEKNLWQEPKHNKIEFEIKLKILHTHMTDQTEKERLDSRDKRLVKILFPFKKNYYRRKIF